jgi:hypothetical protein
MSPPYLFKDVAAARLPGSDASPRRSCTGEYARPMDQRSIGGGTANSPFGCVPSRPLGRSRVRPPPSLRVILRPEPCQPTRCARCEERTVKETQEILLSCIQTPGSAVRVPGPRLQDRPSGRDKESGGASISGRQGPYSEPRRWPARSEPAGDAVVRYGHVHGTPIPKCPDRV